MFSDTWSACGGTPETKETTPNPPAAEHLKPERVRLGKFIQDGNNCLLGVMHTKGADPILRRTPN
jgi:hypothetical protein